MLNFYIDFDQYTFKFWVIPVLFLKILRVKLNILLMIFSKLLKEFDCCCLSLQPCTHPLVT